ncbi:MAG TPA: RNA pseudouridine synthase [Prolixibacteraceae bacterium]|nr:RNA pseudouridine synthase [Prolixibacteraceae bacterium]HPR62541.1 RNA pseudouridine synthase [Prolixibacteraceae bacterium]
MQVIYEDNHIIAVNKTGNEIVQGDKTGDSPLSDIVKAYIKQKYNKPGEVFLGVTHRLDRPTSGVVLFARTGKALTRLNQMFKQKEAIKKTYWAVVNKIPNPPQGTLHHWLVRNNKQNKSYAYDTEKPESKEAIMHYKYLKSSNRFHLLEIDLQTGRHHQIRAQLAAIGCLIKGDMKYGFPRSNPDGGIHLHARKIEFIHPVSKENISILATPPNDQLWNYFVENK